MTIFLVLGAVLVIIALMLITAAIGTTASGRAVGGVDRSVALIEALSGAPRELTKDLDEPFGERIMAPLQERAAKIARRLSGADASERIRHKLDLAGNPAGWTIERVQAGKTIGAISLFFISVALTSLMGMSLTLQIVFVVCATAGGLARPEPVPLPEGLRPIRRRCSASCPTPST